MNLTKSYKFKLIVTPEQHIFLENYFLRYAKAVNFYIKIIQIIRRDYQWLTKKEQIEGECNNCRKKVLLVYRFLPENKLLCPKCYNLHAGDYSLRKILYATRQRKRGKYDVRDAVSLAGTEYALSFKRAVDILKAIRKQIGSMRKFIKNRKERLEMWQEVLNDEKARFVVPRLEGQKAVRYKHIKLKDNPSRGKTESQIKKEIVALSKTIIKTEKSLRGIKSNFRGDIVDLQNTAIKKIDEDGAEITLDGGKRKFGLMIGAVRNEKGRKWLSDILKKIKESKPTYPMLLKQKGNFYLHYPISIDVAEPEIKTKTNYRVMGIDRGVNQIAVSVILDEFQGKPHNIKFYSGRDLMRQKIKFQLIRKKFTGTKNVNRRRAKFGKKLNRISTYLLHYISKNIIDEAKKFKPIVIVMENLKMIQGAKRPKKGSAAQERKINYIMSNFSYRKLQSLLSYKALQAGIPIRLISPEYTSQLCSKCSKPGDRTKGHFKCLNEKCGLQMNADLNAAINIANSYFKHSENS